MNRLALSLTVIVSAANAALGQKTTRVPVADPQAWQNLTYRRIPPNTVDFSSSGLHLAVRSSASPLIHPLAAPMRLKKVIVQLEIIGTLAKPSDPGRWDEDSLFRLGLVVNGDKRLSPFSRALAPDWVRRLYSLAPKDGGVDRIVFLMMGSPSATIGARRLHPSSELIEERIAWLDNGAPGLRALEAVLDPPLDVSALWISADGDDTKSAYALRIKSVEAVHAEDDGSLGKERR
ncbi:MAG: hypothetical protein AAB036_10115 [Elusimicrobiota bacterium]